MYENAPSEIISPQVLPSPNFFALNFRCIMHNTSGFETLAYLGETKKSSQKFDRGIHGVKCTFFEGSCRYLDRIGKNDIT